MASETGPAGLIERLQRVQLRLASLALVVLMLVTVFDVLLRYLFNKPIRGSYDLVECMLGFHRFRDEGGFARRKVPGFSTSSACGFARRRDRTPLGRRRRS